MKVFLLHCWGGNGRSCWSGWIADELRKRGVEVIAPDFPGSSTPELDSWLTEVRKHVQHFDDDWVLVGHSLGCPTILRLLEKCGPDEKIKCAILVAGFASDLGIDQIRNFVDKEFDWDKIRQKANRFIVINSDNDPYIELSEGERMAKLLGTGLIIEPSAGHINEGSGHIKYARLLEILESLSD